MKESRYMTKIVNHYFYGGGRPADVSEARWQAMVKFIRKNFAQYLTNPNESV